jgi:hypothetical protein
MTRPRSTRVSRNGLVSLALLGFLSIAMGSAHATSVVRLNDQQLVGLSTLIVEGRVVEMRSEWNANRTQIHTLVTLQVNQTLKGTKSTTGSLTVRMLGGRVGDIVQQLVDAPTFSIDEEVIVFFERDPSNPVSIAGFNQGKMTVVSDAATGRRVIAERGIPHDEFVDSIARLVATEGGR